MKSQTGILVTLALTVAVVTWLSGCGGGTSAPNPKPPTPSGSGLQTEQGAHEEHAAGKHDEAGHMEGEHKEAAHAEGEHHGAAHKEGAHAEKHAHAEGHGHSEAEMKARVEKLASYAEAMHEIDELREQIEHRIESGKLAEVHPPTELISRIAKRLPELASKSGIARENWKDINTQSRDLANLFDEIDEAADAGKKPETEAAFAKMVKLIDSLKAFAPKEEEKGTQKDKD